MSSIATNVTVMTTPSRTGPLSTALARLPLAQRKIGSAGASRQRSVTPSGITPLCSRMIRVEASALGQTSSSSSRSGAVSRQRPHRVRRHHPCERDVRDAEGFSPGTDWVCEVLLPSTASTDRAVKVLIYAREKVGHVWLVDPLLRTLEVLRLEGPGYRLAGVWRVDVVVQCEPFEALLLRLVDLWSV